jgi:hypothetical protein
MQQGNFHPLLDRHRSQPYCPSSRASYRNPTSPSIIATLTMSLNPTPSTHKPKIKNPPQGKSSTHVPLVARELLQAKQVNHIKVLYRLTTTLLSMTIAQTRHLEVTLHCLLKMFPS